MAILNIKKNPKVLAGNAVKMNYILCIPKLTYFMDQLFQNPFVIFKEVRIIEV